MTSPILTADLAKVVLALAATAQIPGNAAKAVYEAQLALQSIVSGEHVVVTAESQDALVDEIVRAG